MARGYTLVELILVLVLTAILATDVATRNPSGALDAAGVAKQVAGAVRLAQLYSMTKGARYCVHFAATGYALATKGCTQPVTDPITGESTVTLPDGMTLAWAGLPAASVSFSGNGIPYAGGGTTQPLAAAVTVSVADGSSVSRFVITPQTGAVLP